MRYRSLKLTLEFLSGRATGDIILKRSANPSNLLRCFVNKLEPEVADARREPSRKVRTGFLCFSAENGVSAADVGHHRMRPSTRIPQRDPVAFAGPPAILIAGAGGKKAAENTVFGVEDRQVVIGDNL